MEKGFMVRDILTSCPLTGDAIRTGLNTGHVMLTTLPRVAIPVHCASCGNQHFWLPDTAWIDGEERPVLKQPSISASQPKPRPRPSVDASPPALGGPRAG